MTEWLYSIKSTNLSPSKKTLTQMTPTWSDKKIKPVVSITNNLRINQAKATRAIKSKVINQHMAHSHSSSALSALKVAEENIRISLLNKSNF